MRHATNRTLIVLAFSALATACSSTGAEPRVTSPAPDPVIPAPDLSASVEQSTAAPGSSIDVQATGFAANQQVRIGIGPPASEYTVVATTTADGMGSVSARVTLPGWAERGRPYVAVVDAGASATRAVSEPFVVGAAGDSISVQGELTTEGVECPALRGRSGALYTLATGRMDFAPGTRVRVTGTIAGVSTCMQGTVIAVESIERVDR